MIKYVIILQNSLMSNVLFMKREAKEVLKKIFDMNISEIPTDEMLIIMDKIKSDENSWIDKETVRALSERNIEKTKEPNGVVVMNPDINGDYEEKIKIR